MTELSALERGFLSKNEICRLATASRRGLPHVTPVIYALDGDSFIVVIDYGTKKLGNLRENPLVSLVVDECEKKGHRAVMVRGRCEILEKGLKYRRVLRIFFQRFNVYRKKPWKEGEAPIIKVNPIRVVSWGLRTPG